MSNFPWRHSRNPTGWCDLHVDLHSSFESDHIHLTRVSVRRHASAHAGRRAAARAASVRRARADLHLPVERVHAGAALPRDHTVGPARKVPVRKHLEEKGPKNFS